MSERLRGMKGAWRVCKRQQSDGPDLLMTFGQLYVFVTVQRNPT